jgi:hypothetical protein
VYSALGKGLNYAISLVVLPIDGILTGVEKAIVFLLILLYFFFMVYFNETTWHYMPEDCHLQLIYPSVLSN